MKIKMITDLPSFKLVNKIRGMDIAMTASFTVLYYMLYHSALVSGDNILLYIFLLNLVIGIVSLFAAIEYGGIAFKKSFLASIYALFIANIFLILGNINTKETVVPIMTVDVVDSKNNAYVKFINLNTGKAIKIIHTNKKNLSHMMSVYKKVKNVKIITDFVPFVGFTKQLNIQLKET